MVKKIFAKHNIRNAEYFLQGVYSDEQSVEPLFECLQKVKIADSGFEFREIYDLVATHPNRPENPGTPNELITVRRPLFNYEAPDIISFLGPIHKLNGPHQVILRSRTDTTAKRDEFDWISELDFYKARLAYVARGYELIKENSSNLTTIRVYQPYKVDFEKKEMKLPAIIEDLKPIYNGHIIELNVHAPPTPLAVHNVWATIDYFKKILQPFVSLKDTDVYAVDVYK